MPPFLFWIAGKMEQVTLKNIGGHAPIDDRPLVWIQPDAKIDRLVIDGLNVHDPPKQPGRAPLIRADGRIALLQVRDVVVQRPQAQAPAGSLIATSPDRSALKAFMEARHGIVNPRGMRGWPEGPGYFTMPPQIQRLQITDVVRRRPGAPPQSPSRNHRSPRPARLSLSADHQGRSSGQVRRRSSKPAHPQRKETNHETHSHPPTALLLAPVTAVLAADAPKLQPTELPLHTPQPKWTAQVRGGRQAGFHQHPFRRQDTQQTRLRHHTARMPDGSWVMVMLGGGDTEPRPENHVLLTRSHDKCKTWSPMQPLDFGFPREGNTIAMVPSELMVLPDRCTLFFATHDGTFAGWKEWMTHSEDGCHTWSKPEPRRAGCMTAPSSAITS